MLQPPTELHLGLFGWVLDKLAAPALVAVLFTGLTSYFLEIYRGRRDLATKIADVLREDLKAVGSLATIYWSRERKEEDDLIEAQILGLQTEIGSEITLLDSLLAEPILTKSPHRLPDLFDALTGGRFQQLDRVADPSRVQRITRAISVLRFEIIRSRIRSIGKLRH